MIAVKRKIRAEKVNRFRGEYIDLTRKNVSSFRYSQSNKFVVRCCNIDEYMCAHIRRKVLIEYKS